MRRFLRILFGVEVDFARLEERLANREVVKAEACLQLLGPVHGTVQTIRGMCADELRHEEIDAKLAELDDLVYGAAKTLGHPL